MSQIIKVILKSIWVFSGANLLCYRMKLWQKLVCIFHTLSIHYPYTIHTLSIHYVPSNWYKLGTTTIDAVPSNNLYDDWRVGATFSAPLSKSQSLRLQYHTGLLANLGLNYDSLTLAYQYVFF